VRPSETIRYVIKIVPAKFNCDKYQQRTTYKVLMNSDLTTCSRRSTSIMQANMKLRLSESMFPHAPPCHSLKVSCWKVVHLTYTLSTMSNHLYTLGSPPPTLLCPHCPRRFKSKSGRTRHIATHLVDGPEDSEPLAPDRLSSPIPSLPPSFHNPSTVPSHSMPSPIPSLPPSFHDPSPVPSHFIPSPIPSLVEPSFHDPSPVPSHFIPSSATSFDGFNTDTDIEHQHTNASRMTRVFHPKLNGMSFFFFYIFFDVNSSICTRGDLRREWEWLTT
jgi:hypothetical protein